ncbi:MAG: uncharacterized protein A8A55_2538 [Amphiamblys sp. WSBS2006]|nr:MAG: uncharacterized protein A8A55_2538 [Amphiamblys sp. WSBS2006]
MGSTVKEIKALAMLHPRKSTRYQTPETETVEKIQDGRECAPDGAGENTESWLEDSPLPTGIADQVEEPQDTVMEEETVAEEEKRVKQTQESQGNQKTQEAKEEAKARCEVRRRRIAENEATIVKLRELIYEDKRELMKEALRRKKQRQSGEETAPGEARQYTTPGFVRGRQSGQGNGREETSTMVAVPTQRGAKKRVVSPTEEQAMSFFAREQPETAVVGLKTRGGPAGKLKAMMNALAGTRGRITHVEQDRKRGIVWAIGDKEGVKRVAEKLDGDGRRRVGEGELEGLQGLLALSIGREDAPEWKKEKLRLLSETETLKRALLRNGLPPTEMEIDPPTEGSTTQ